jgi:hypothetical protein
LKLRHRISFRFRNLRQVSLHRPDPRVQPARAIPDRPENTFSTRVKGGA